jgi:hypothetical protein
MTVVVFGHIPGEVLPATARGGMGYVTDGPHGHGLKARPL